MAKISVLRYHWKSSTTSWSYYVSISDFHACMLENFHRVEKSQRSLALIKVCRAWYIQKLRLNVVCPKFYLLFLTNFFIFYSVLSPIIPALFFTFLFRHNDDY